MTRKDRVESLYELIKDCPHFDPGLVLNWLVHKVRRIPPFKLVNTSGGKLVGEIYHAALLDTIKAAIARKRDVIDQEIEAAQRRREDSTGPVLVQEQPITEADEVSRSESWPHPRELTQQVLPILGFDGHPAEIAFRDLNDRNYVHVVEALKRQRHGEYKRHVEPIDRLRADLEAVRQTCYAVWKLDPDVTVGEIEDGLVAVVSTDGGVETLQRTARRVAGDSE